MKAVAIIQARMGSSRLPGKVLLDIAGKPMLVHVIERVLCANTLDHSGTPVIVATTTDPGDDPIEAECRKQGYPVFRGSVHDVLDRYYQAARTLVSPGEGHMIVRITGDCPTIEPELIDLAVQAVQASNPGFDFACTRLPPPWHRTFPIGLDVEVCTFNALERAWQNASQAYHREHVMPYLYEECRSVHYGTILGRKSPMEIPPGKQHTILQELRPLLTSPPCEPDPFRVLVFDHQPDYGNHRWTVDTPEDLEAIRKIFSQLSDRRDRMNGTRFHWYEVIDLIQRVPELAYLNTDGKAKDYREFDRRQNGLSSSGAQSSSTEQGQP